MLRLNNDTTATHSLPRHLELDANGVAERRCDRAIAPSRPVRRRTVRANPATTNARIEPHHCAGAEYLAGSQSSSIIKQETYQYRYDASIVTPSQPRRHLDC